MARLTIAQKMELSLRELFELEAATKPNVKKNIESLLKQLGNVTDSTGAVFLDMKVKDLQDEKLGMVLADVITDSPFAESDKAATKRRARSANLIDKIGTMYKGQLNVGSGPGYAKNATEIALGDPKKFEENTFWSKKRARKSATGFDSDIYKKAKEVISDPEIPLELRQQMTMNLLGGNRTANLANFDIKNYDPVNGMIVFDDPKSGKKVLVLNEVSNAIVQQNIGDRKSGKIFPNAKSNETTINKILRERMPEVTFRTPEGDLRTEKFTIYKFRNMNESLLADEGLTPSESQLLSGRADASEASGYVDEETKRRKIKRATDRVVAKIVAYSGTPTVAQYAADVGMDFGEASNIAVTKDVITNPKYIEHAPKEFVDALPDGPGGVYPQGEAPKADPKAQQQFLESAQASSAESREASLLAAEETKSKRLEIQEQNIAKEAEIDKKRKEAKKPSADAPAAISDEGKGTMQRIKDVLRNKVNPSVKKGAKALLPGAIGTTLFGVDAFMTGEQANTALAAEGDEQKRQMSELGLSVTPAAPMQIVQEVNPLTHMGRDLADESGLFQERGYSSTEETASGFADIED